MIHRDTYWSQAQDAASFLGEAGMFPVDAVLQCGSGLNGLAETLMPGARRIPLDSIPHLPAAAVTGHGKEAVYGAVGGTKVLVLTGRVHVYEGYDPLTAGFIGALGQALEARLFLATNAAGALNPEIHQGEVMVHTDFINMMGDNAAAHLATDRPAERFIDPKPAYDEAVSAVLTQALAHAGLKVHRGVYISMRGPLYETLAELKMLRALGGDAIGMSTVPEVTVCHLFGLPVVALSAITNECLAAAHTTHAGVVARSAALAPALGTALRAFFAGWTGG